MRRHASNYYGKSNIGGTRSRFDLVPSFTEIFYGCPSIHAHQESSFISPQDLTDLPLYVYTNKINNTPLKFINRFIHYHNYSLTHHKFTMTFTNFG